MEFKINIFFLLLSTLVNFHSCQRCQHQTATVYNCSSLSLTDIPSERLGQIYKLDLSSNAITTLKNDSFLDRGFQNIGVLFMQDNKIMTIEANAFRGMKDLNFINLCNNDIADLPEDIFQWNTKLNVLRLENNTRLKLPKTGFNLPQLTILDLESCGLETIPTNFFSNMSDLEILYLRRNKLSYLDPQLIRHLHELEFLDLRDNLFTKLQLDILRLPLIFKVSFVGNPLHCDCSLVRAYSLYKKKALFEELSCTNGDNKHTTELYRLVIQLDCKSSSTTTAILPVPTSSYKPETDVRADNLDSAGDLQENKYLHNDQDDLENLTAPQIGIIVLCVIILLILLATFSFFIVKNRRSQFLATNRFQILQGGEVHLSNI